MLHSVRHSIDVSEHQIGVTTLIPTEGFVEAVEGPVQSDFRPLLVALILTTLTFPFPVSAGTQTPASRNVPVGTVLYLWYGFNYTSGKRTGGLGTSHWNDSSSGVVKDKPDIGYYASLDNSTLAWQLTQMKDARLSWILVSWWGTGNASQSVSPILDSAINHATLNLFRYLAAYRSLFQFKVAIMVEAFNSTDLSASDYSQLYRYVDSNFVRPFNSSYFYWEGKPLVASFNPQRLPPPYNFTYREIGSPPNQVDWNFWEGDGYLTASGGTAQPAKYQSAPGVSTDGEVGMIWRYDDYYLYLAGGRTGYMRFDPFGSMGLYGHEWNYADANAGRIKLILLYGWNEYHERVSLECHADSTAGHFCGTGETVNYVDRFEATSPSQGGIADWFLIVVILLFLVALLATLIIRAFRRVGKTV